MMPEDVLNDTRPEGAMNISTATATQQQQAAAPHVDNAPPSAAASGDLQTSKSLTAAVPSPFAAAAQEPLPSAPDSPADAAQIAAEGSSSKPSCEDQQQQEQEASEQQRKQQQEAHDGVALLAAALEVQSPDSQQQQDQDDPAAAAAAAADVDMEPEPPVDPALMANFENALASVMLRPVAVNEANDLRSDLEALTNFDIELVNKSRRGPVGSSSKFRGVTQHRRTRRWEAHIWDSKKQVYLGGFDNEVQAAKAHDVMAIKTRGPKTIINFKVVVYEELLDWLANPQLTKEGTVSALRKSSRRISSGKKRSRSSYPLSPTRSPPRSSRNHSSSSSGAAAALQSLANAHLPAAAQSGGSRHHQNALDAALAAAAAAAAAEAVDVDVGRMRKGAGNRDGRMADLLGVTAGGVSKNKGVSSERNSYIQVDSSGVVVNMPRSSPALLDLPLPAAAHANPSISSSITNLGKLGYKSAAASSGLGLSSSMGLSSGFGLNNLGGGLGLGFSDDDIMLPPSAILEAVLDRGSMFDHRFDQALTGFDQGLGATGVTGNQGLVGVTTFRGCPGDALGLKGISNQGFGMLGIDPLGPHGVSRPSSLLLLQQRLQQQHQSMPVPPTAARQQVLLAQQRQQQMELQQQQHLQIQLQQQQQMHQQRLQYQQQQQQQLHLQQQQQHAASMAQAAAAAAAGATTTNNLRDITSVHNPNNAFTDSKEPAAAAAARLLNAPESDPLVTAATDALLMPSTAAAATASEEPANVLVSSGFVGLDFDSSNFSVGSSLPLGAADLIFDPPAASAAAAAAADHQPLYHEPTGSMTANNTADGSSPVSGFNNSDNSNTAIAAAAAAAAAAEAAAMMEASRAVQRELAIRREAGLALLMGNRVGKARV